MTSRMTWRDHLPLVLHQLADGVSLARIAGVLGCSVDALSTAINRHGRSVHAARNGMCAVRSLSATARLFGVSDHIARTWVRRGWLIASRNGARKQRRSSRNSHFLITDLALMEFLEVRHAWVTYDPAQITDPDWRSAAEDARRRAGGRWVRVTDYLRQRHYHPNYAWHQIKRQWIAAEKIHNTWYVWEACDGGNAIS